MADADNFEQVALGKKVYYQHCANCHGEELEGQENWRKRKPNGRLPAPPHDDSGHTWHHPDQMLFDIIKNGLVAPYAPDNYETDMPAWQGRISEEEMWAVLAFIKSRWSEEKRHIQQDINRKSKENS